MTQPNNGRWTLRDTLVVIAGLVLHAFALAIFLRWARKP